MNTIETSQLVEDWFRTAKLPHDEPTKTFLDRCESHAIEVGGKSYKYYRRGSGPTVLLVHGFSSNLGSMTAIAEDLLDQQYEVVLFDAPAHGEAPGTSTDPIQIGAVIHGISERFAELHAVVGHSLGGLWFLAAWNRGLRAKAFVTIAAPAKLRFLVEKMADFYPVTDDQIDELAREIESRLGAEVWADLSPSEVVKAIDRPGLIIHGTNDDYVPAQHAAEIHSSWRGSTLELIDDVDHFAIVRSRKVRDLLSTFLKQV